LFAAVVYEYGADFQILATISGLVFVGVLVVLAGTDIEYRLLPNVIVGPAAVAGLVFSILMDPERWWVYVVSMVAVAGALFALVLAYPRGMGMGDVKMAGMLGAFLGPYAGLAVFLGALCGMVVSVVLMAGGVIGRRAAIPFGTFLAVGGVLTLFVGRNLWNYYLNFVGAA
jgi:leader peptidase (prepilin peptidase)/N-methyltransferase